MAGSTQPGAPRDEGADAATRRPAELNEAHKRRLSVSCEYIDRLLEDVEHILGSNRSSSPFPRYIADINPAQAEALKSYIRDLREQLLRALAWQQMKAKEPEIPASRAVLINLDYIGIAIEELKPRYMRGCGPVPEDAVDGLNRVAAELSAAAERMEHYLLREIGAAASAEANVDRQQAAAPCAEETQPGGRLQKRAKEGDCKSIC